jgi:hypothetical protein
MAVYKVPRDVEASDHIIGFLSLKQFIFVLMMFASVGLGYLFATRVTPWAAIPWVIPTIFFGILGLYQRHDQPVEVFLLSWFKFKFGKKIKRWDQEGYEEKVEITIPKKEQVDYTKGLDSSDVTRKLNQISENLDTRGWASKD